MKTNQFAQKNTMLPSVTDWLGLLESKPQIQRRVERAANVSLNSDTLPIDF